VTARLAGYVTVNLMTFDKQSNGRRTAVESKSNRSCNHRITVSLLLLPLFKGGGNAM